MSRHGPRPSTLPSDRPAVTLPCLRCDRPFQSENKATHRLCADCRRGSEGFDAPWIAGGNVGRRVQSRGQG